MLHYSDLHFIEMPWQPLITTEESKSSFINLKYISLLCKTWCQSNKCLKPEVGWSYDFLLKKSTLFILVKLVNGTVSIFFKYGFLQYSK